MKKKKKDDNDIGKKRVFQDANDDELVKQLLKLQELDNQEHILGKGLKKETKPTNIVDVVAKKKNKRMGVSPVVTP